MTSSYVDLVTTALGNYTSDILLMAEEGHRVMAKLRFHGLHQRELFGVAPTGRHVWWHECRSFTFEGAKVRDLWVLGDIHNLIARLKGGHAGDAGLAPGNLSRRLINCLVEVRRMRLAASSA